MIKLFIQILKELKLLRTRNVFIIIGFLFLGFLEGVADGLGIGMITSFFTSLAKTTPERLELFQTSYSFLPDIIVQSERNLGITIIFLFLGRLVILLVTANLRCILPQTLTYLIRAKLVERTLSFSLVDLEKKRLGKIVNLLITDTERASLFVFALIDSVYLICLVASYMAVMASINYLVFGIFVLLLVPLGFILKYMVSKLTEFSRQLLNIRNTIVSDFTERFSNLRFIKSLGTEDYEYRNISKGFKDFRNIEVRRFFFEYFGNMQPQIFIFMIIVGTVLIVFYREGLYKEFLIAYLLPMGFIASRTFTYISMINFKFMRIKQAQVSAEAIFDFWREFDTQAYFLEDDAEMLEAELQRIDTVRFNNVSFAYDSKVVLSGFDLTLERGKPVILRGESGSGKTTVANLLRLLIKPTRGDILFNGKSVNDRNAFELRNKIGYATQDAILIYGTVKNNLLYGLSREVSQNEIENVLKKVKAYSFVTKLESGLDSVVSEKGTNLSGGQKQRIALARILLREPDILILDEITNGLDEEAKKEVLGTINDIAKDIICIVITHDTTFKLADSEEVIIAENMAR